MAGSLTRFQDREQPFEYEQFFSLGAGGGDTEGYKPTSDLAFVFLVGWHFDWPCGAFSARPKKGRRTAPVPTSRSLLSSA